MGESDSIVNFLVQINEIKPSAFLLSVEGTISGPLHNEVENPDRSFIPLLYIYIL